MKWMFNNSNLNYDITFPMLSCDTMSDLLASNDIINLSYSNTTTSRNSYNSSDSYTGSDSEISIEITQSNHQSDDDDDDDDGSSENVSDGNEEEDEEENNNDICIKTNVTNKKQRYL